MARHTLEDQIAAFRAYVDDYFAPPVFNRWLSEQHGRRRGEPPDTLAVASAVIQMFGGGPGVERWAWELPIGKAYWYSSTLHYNNGAPLDYMTAREVAIRKLLARQDPAKLKADAEAAMAKSRVDEGLMRMLLAQQKMKPPGQP